MATGDVTHTQKERIVDFEGGKEGRWTWTTKWSPGQARQPAQHSLALALGPAFFHSLAVTGRIVGLALFCQLSQLHQS